MRNRRFRYSGLPSPDDPFHYTLDADFVERPYSENTVRIKPMRFVQLRSGQHVAVWEDTIKASVTGFQPSNDCNGYFTAVKYQVNNNCYNYACNIATNSFAIPGRLHGAKYDESGSLAAQDVIAAAQADGLKLIGESSMPLAHALSLLGSAHPGNGHLVALLISTPDPDIRWRGDFHFVRSDDPHGRKWSHKAGYDSITNFDFAGTLVSDPSDSTVACWTVNQGPAQPGSGGPAFISRYDFAAWMFVPVERVEII